MTGENVEPWLKALAATEAEAEQAIQTARDRRRFEEGMRG